MNQLGVERSAHATSHNVIDNRGQRAIAIGSLDDNSQQKAYQVQLEKPNKESLVQMGMDAMEI